MSPEDVFRRYRELQAYVGWTDDAARKIAAVTDLLAPHLPALVEDFYAEIDRHPLARKVITGGPVQVERLKGTLLAWLGELLTGRYDAEYVARRWRVGWRHVEIGLDQVYTNAALSRLRTGLVRALEDHWRGPAPLGPTLRALNQLLDLDLALIEDAYQAELTARLQRSERLATIGQVAEAAPCLIVIVRPDRTIAYFSRFAEEITGHRADEVIGRDYLATLLPEEQRGEANALLDRVFAGEMARAAATPVVHTDGSFRWVLWNVRLLPHHDGGPAALAIGQDITGLREAQERTLQAERLAAIGQMVTGLAHESGNALARSQACLEMLALEVQDRPDAIDLVGRVQKAQDHLQKLYDEVRTYAAPMKIEREVCRLDGVWRQAWTNLAVRRQDRDARLCEECAEVDLRCRVDAFRLEQVFRNMLENSLAASRDPVVVTIEAGDTLLDGKPALRVAVRDNGPGLAPEQRQRIFDPFFTTKTRGTGLGMAIAKRIIEAHGGRIAVGQDRAPGAEILLLLPREGQP